MIKEPFLKHFGEYMTILHGVSGLFETSLLPDKSINTKDIDVFMEEEYGLEETNLTLLLEEYEIDSVQFIEKVGGIHNGEDVQLVFYIPKFNSYYQIIGFYSSYSGYEFTSRDQMIEVYPIEVTNIKYVTKK